MLLTWFTFTRAEKHAAVILTGVLLLLQGVLLFRNHHAEAREITVAEPAAGYSTVPAPKKSERMARERNLAWFCFDPDTATVPTLVQLGMSEKQAASMLRFREKSGGFHTVAELRKVKVLRPELLEQWLPYLRFSQKEGKASPQARPMNKPNHHPPRWEKLNINTADTLLLQTLPLIGPGRARAIAAYRERLGGYIECGQLLELKAIPDSVFQVIAPRIFSDGQVFRPLALNRMPADSLRHPYLPKPLGRIIVQYRDQHGPFRSLHDLEKLPLVNAEILTKIAPYLNFNP